MTKFYFFSGDPDRRFGDTHYNGGQGTLFEHLAYLKTDDMATADIWDTWESTLKAATDDESLQDAMHTASLSGMPLYVVNEDYNVVGSVNMPKEQACNSDESEKSPVWDGEGVPPVGAECLVQLEQSEPLEAKIEYVGKNFVAYTLFKLDEPNTLHDRECCAQLSYIKFKPLPTEKDKLVEEACELILVLGKEAHSTDVGVVTKMIEAGYRLPEPFQEDHHYEFSEKPDNRVIAFDPVQLKIFDRLLKGEPINGQEKREMYPVIQQVQYLLGEK